MYIGINAYWYLTNNQPTNQGKIELLCSWEVGDWAESRNSNVAHLHRFRACSTWPRIRETLFNMWYCPSIKEMWAFGIFSPTLAAIHFPRPKTRGNFHLFRKSLEFTVSMTDWLLNTVSLSIGGWGLGVNVSMNCTKRLDNDFESLWCTVIGVLLEVDSGRVSWWEKLFPVWSLW